jgi:DNA helicase II / ATP-dependent DNA helicase PcrA
VTTPLQLNDDRKRLLRTDGPLLILGGPGAGKTSIALLKAAEIIAADGLKSGQQVLFLSFARATITRVAQHAQRLVSAERRRSLEINTYHGFAWGILQSHGYLLSKRRRINLLTPPDAAARFAHLSTNEREAEKHRLFIEEGLLHFDLFAPVGAELLHRSDPLAAIISNAYPVIILDEFQDTNSSEWNLMQSLGKRSTLIALADPDQRIYEFRGADPARIQDFVTASKPTLFDFAGDNHRSNGTDIVNFANDLLTDAHKGKTYKNVAVSKYAFYAKKHGCYTLKLAVLDGLKRVAKKGVPWSIACLVPTKRLMLFASDYFSSKADDLPALHHDVAMDQEGPALAASLIAGLMEGGSVVAMGSRFITDLCNHMRGRRGLDSPPQMELEFSTALADHVATGKKLKGKVRLLVVSEATRIAKAVRELAFTGNPVEDWLAVRGLLEGSPAEFIQQVVSDARYLRLLTKGSSLRDQLAELWRERHDYRGALACVQNALKQEHFSASLHDPAGIQIMTIHKSKGKEFDEVFIFEGFKQGKIVRADADAKAIAQARLSLRVAVTRARKRATIMFPKAETCRFFL